jgi:glutathione synthase/RimK-type ligase-like ATP-grasp enzyme
LPVPIIITDELDSAQPVIDELSSRGVSHVVLTSLSLTDHNNGMAVTSSDEGTYADLYIGDRSVRVDRGSPVWRWKARTPGPDIVLDENQAVSRMKVAQYRSTVRSLWEVPALWMNKFSSEVRLEQNKSLGADIARRCGLTVPDTLITDSPGAFLNFIRSSRSDFFAIKAPSAWAAIDECGKTFGSYTVRLDRLAALDAAPFVAHAPVILQPYVEKAYELRVTCVAGELFCCRIDSQASTQTRVDWRVYPEVPVSHAAMHLPLTIQRKLRAFLIACDLVYATLDLIVTPDDEVVFLEVNPSGQYLWIEELSHLQITQAIANWLCRDPRSSASTG